MGQYENGSDLTWLPPQQTWLPKLSQISSHTSSARPTELLSVNRILIQVDSEW